MGERVYVLYAMTVTFPTNHAERSPLKAAASLNTKIQENIKNKFSQTAKEEGKKRQPRKSVRTVSHLRHLPDLPCGEITIKGTSSMKHCTTHSNNKKSNDKNGFEKKEEESIVKT